MNIISPFEYDDSLLYELDPCFQTEALYGLKSVLGDRTGWTIAEFEALAASLDDMLAYMIRFASHDFIDGVDRTCDFENKQLIEVLEFCRALREEQTSDSGTIIVGTLYRVFVITSQPLNFSNLCWLLSNNSGGSSAMAQCSFGIASNTQYPDACWDFMKLLLAEEQQTQIMSSMGFPIMCSVLDAQTEQAMLDKDNPDSIIYGSEFEALSQKEADYLLNLISSLSHSLFRYTAVLEIILEEAEGFFLGIPQLKRQRNLCGKS